VVFLDIRMPGMSGLEVASALAEDWAHDHLALPHIVFVTAYDQYAIQAFDAQAVDYLLKPVHNERLQQCIARIQRTSGLPQHRTPLSLHQSVQHIAQSIDQPTPQPRLSTISASIGQTIHRIGIDDVLFFSAADKYVRVVTAEREYLIRTPIKTLLPQLDPEVFWQIHRSHVVRASAVSKVKRDSAGKTWVDIKGHAEPLIVSRLYTERFKAM
jgi:DNA-binding LytR/AlgR family response regulator